ncbi:rhodanese-like domain-containing protein [Capnocytophaga cynodegmi]|uniref:rhodanese-like domain-containing protein n=1 Tax=Capnocytophaga cynodegmi TaxID=28189 RepID=UPI0003794D0A|nr:rhodanese-like domain-containing protein [Capnocytophaga cynodegmi]CEN35304.1 putative Thiosulfate sulfurtransferase [Capnocytophaga cynodegmi]
MKRVFILMMGLSSCQLGDSSKHIAMEKYEPSSEGILVDIRTPEEFSEGHLENAVNINFFDEDFVSNFEKEFDKNDTIYIHCKSGGRSTKAVQILEGKGYKNLIHLDGGILRWLEAGKPVEK